jgi:hypothetical protein
VNDEETSAESPDDPQDHGDAGLSDDVCLVAAANSPGVEGSIRVGLWAWFDGLALRELRLGLGSRFVLGRLS